MSRPPRALATALLLAAGAAVVYAQRLDVSPIYLAPDEVTIALNAHSIASTGRDLSGRFLPLYIHIFEASWFQPLIVYSLALVFKVLPLSEWTIRLPVACVGITDVVLMYFLARTLFKNEALAIVTAVLLALTPAHFLHSRFALDYIYPLPFILAWLLSVFTYLDTDDPKMLFVATTVLGLGFYSYIAAVLVMPMYFVFTCLMLFVRDRPARAYGVAAAGFALPLLLLFVPWLIAHPEAYADTITRYTLYDPARMNALQGLREFLTYTNVSSRVSIYWGYFNPSFLFLDASTPMMFSTRWTGVFLIPIAAFLPVGLYRAMTGRDLKYAVLLWGFVTAPLAALLVEEPAAINRALELLPFTILLAALGVGCLWSATRVEHRRAFCLAASAAGLVTGAGYALWRAAQGRGTGSSLLLLLASIVLAVIGLSSDRTAWRIVVVGLLLVVPIQFLDYYRDYFTEYRSRSSGVFQSNIRGGLEYIIERESREHAPVIYLSSRIRAIDSYWRLYLLKHRREDLLARTVVFGNQLNADTMPAGSVVLAGIGEPEAKALAQAGELQTMTLITEPGNVPSFAVFKR